MGIRKRFFERVKGSKSPHVRALVAFELAMNPFVLGAIFVASVIGCLIFGAFIFEQQGPVRWLVLLPLLLNLFPWFFASIGYLGALFDEMHTAKTNEDIQNSRGT